MKKSSQKNTITYSKKIPYQILQKLKYSKTSFDGFHHDLNGFERNKIIRHIEPITGKGGCIKSMVEFAGKRQSKTLFPSHWSREKVAQKALEAIHEFERSGRHFEIKPSGVRQLTGYTIEGIELRIIVNPAGKINCFPEMINFK